MSTSGALVAGVSATGTVVAGVVSTAGALVAAVVVSAAGVPAVAVLATGALTASSAGLVSVDEFNHLLKYKRDLEQRKRY